MYETYLRYFRRIVWNLKPYPNYGNEFNLRSVCLMQTVHFACVHVCVCGFFLLTVASFVKQTERKTAYNACTTCEWIGGKRRSEERGTKEWSAAVIHTVDCDVCWSTLTVAYTTNREKKFGIYLAGCFFPLSSDDDLNADRDRGTFSIRQQQKTRSHSMWFPARSLVSNIIHSILHAV